MVVIFFFPETKGLGLEEIAQIFGEDISDLAMEADVAIIELKGNELKSQADHMESVSLQNSAKANYPASLYFTIPVIWWMGDKPYKRWKCGFIYF